MSVFIQVHRIPVREVLALRTTILRPNQSPGTHSLPGDESPETYHAGAYLEGKLVGVASVFQEAAPFAERANAWRLRGMAVKEEARRTGCGMALVKHCLEYISQQGGDLVWCHGRTSVMPFYQALGFRPHGEEFDVPVSGPHYVMWRPVRTPGQEIFSIQAPASERKRR
jgi:predicted GNAT family N-acyltransferase